MRWIVRVGAALAVVVVLAFGLLATVPSERIAQAVSGQFETMTGRKLEMLGEIKTPDLAKPGRHHRPGQHRQCRMVHQRPAVVPRPEPVGRRQSERPSGWRGEDPGPDGRPPRIQPGAGGRRAGGWVFAAVPRARPSAGAVPPPATGFTLDKGSIAGGRLVYLDRQSGRSVTLDEVDASLSIPDFTGPFALTATATFQRAEGGAGSVRRGILGLCHGARRSGQGQSGRGRHERSASRGAAAMRRLPQKVRWSPICPIFPHWVP